MASTIKIHCKILNKINRIWQNYLNIRVIPATLRKRSSILPYSKIPKNLINSERPDKLVKNYLIGFYNWTYQRKSLENTKIIWNNFQIFTAPQEMGLLFFHIQRCRTDPPTVRHTGKPFKTFTGLLLDNKKIESVCWADVITLFLNFVTLLTVTLQLK